MVSYVSAALRRSTVDALFRPPPRLTRPQIFLLELHSTLMRDDTFENTLSYPMMDEFHKALDVVEAYGKENRCALVTTAKTGKIFSNGLDIATLMDMPRGGEEQFAFLRKVHELYSRLIVFPVPTIAAVQGHAMAGGMLLALAHDYRVANTAKGFWCMTEINIGAALTPPLNDFFLAKIADKNVAAKILLTGDRYSAAEALEMKVVDVVESGIEAVRSKALEMAERVADKSASPAFADLKVDVWRDAAKSLLSGIVARPSKL